MSDNKIFVGNLPHFISDENLRTRFSQHGNIRDFYYCKDILGSDRGWATITYMNSDEAATAIGVEDGVDDPFPGSERPLHVKFFNTPLTSREGTVFDLRPKNQKVLTPWTENEDEHGTKFYVNLLTEESSWERPAELDLFVQHPNGANVIMDSGVGLLDEENEQGAMKYPDGRVVGAEEGGLKALTGNLNRSVPSACGSGDLGPPGCNLFIHGNLSNVTDTMAYEAFKDHGQLVGCKIHIPAANNGFGYISYSEPAACVAAIKELNLNDVFGTGAPLKIMLKKGEETFNKDAQKAIEEGLVAGMKKVDI
ncbi:unnamed protein product [Amoebophrya sp. A120]|nr:unnamed protein product [Amoebophrya sp. A120]|eukprot:GSA120T00009122001.1